LQNDFLPSLTEGLQKETEATVHCYIEKEEPQTIVLAYPYSFQDATILPIIRLEIGALAIWTPVTAKAITPYVATQYPKLFKQPSTDILSVLPERTFWEKATILHQEAHRSEEKVFPARYSRHYYDLYCLLGTSAKDAAFANMALLDQVARFKNKFYRCPWAKYENAKPGTMKLVPSKRKCTILENDYKHMQSMIFGIKPAFVDIIKGIEELEKEINSSDL
jgi:hypothetical protein